MDSRTPVSRLRHAGALALICALLLAVACNKPADKVPEVQGKKPVAVEAPPPKVEQPKGFALASANAEQYEGQLALILSFSQPIVGTQAFDTLIAVSGPKGENVQGSWALDEDGKTLRFP